MRPARPKESVYESSLWLAVITSGLLIGWQGFAFFSGRIPDHILPLVRLLSGTQEAIPIAYAWTPRLGLLSAAVFIGSALGLGWLRFTRKRAQTSL